MNFGKFAWVCGFALLGACGGDFETGEAEEIAFESEGIGEAGCATLAPNWTRWGLIKTSSPATYGQSGCAKAMIIDIQNFGNVPGATPTIRTTWADPMPRTEAACLATSVRTDVYAQQGSPPVYTRIGTQTVFGRWNPRTFSCNASKTLFTLTPGLTYRFVAQSLTSPNGSTLSFSIRND